MKKPVYLALVLLVGLAFGGVQAADRGPLKYAEGQYDAASAVYTVVKGDDLDAIAERFGVAVAELKAQNKLVSAKVEVGQKLVIAASAPAGAPQITGVLGSPSATTTIPGNQLPAPQPKFGGVIKDDALQSKPWWAPRIVPPKGAPNVLLIITDDAGFGVPSTFGGVIPTPTMDRIASEGLRYNRMFSTALCSPTRAALITGRNHHSVGFGVIAEQATGFPGYNSIIGVDKATIGRILLDNGYVTSWFGKDHNTPAFQASQSGPFNPVADRHGLRVLLRLRRRRRQPVGAEPVPQHHADLSVDRSSASLLEPSWNLITAMADDAIDWMTRMHQTDPQADLHQVRARRHARAAPSDQGMGGQDQRDEPVRRWLREAARAHLREPEEARRDPQGFEADSLAQRRADALGQAHSRSEEALHPPG